MSMALPSGYENVVHNETSDHHADQNFEPDLATHEATVRYSHCIGKHASMQENVQIEEYLIMNLWCTIM